MQQVQEVLVIDQVVLETINVIRVFGKKGYEALVLWLGEIDQDKARITRAVIPSQKSISSEDGVGYFVESGELFQLNRVLDESGLRLIAQVHSHPGEAYHSSTDDKYAIVTSEGGYSLVVPNFRNPPVNVLEWASYRLMEGDWVELTPLEAKQTFRIEKSA
jgi:hypothetical protein